MEEYFGQVVFYQERSFTRAQFRRFMFAQSKPYPEMIELIARHKVRHGLKVSVVNNEARELNANRIQRFKLDGFVDFFIASALSTSASRTRTFELPWTSPNASPSGSLYRKHPMFVQIAEGLGMRSILHTDYSSTCAKLAAFGLQNGEQVIHETS
jgi:putative hydrolase of the HAD superfamily